MDKNIVLLNWINFSKAFLKENIESRLSYIDEAISNRTFLVGDDLSDADRSIYQALMSKEEFRNLRDLGHLSENIIRYLKHLESLDVKYESCVKSTESPKNSENKLNDKTKLNEKAKTNDKSKTGDVKFEEGGKYISLQSAVHGQVVVRFPPEASGYLHIGHAKAALINFHYRNEYNGKLIMRFDDTNPDKESELFEKIILEDVKSLGIKFDKLSFASDHFGTLIGYCEKLIEEGKAYVDLTEPELMKQQREKCEESIYRSQSVAENMRLWNEMKLGSNEGIKGCVRIKIDMQSKNGCMRDPTIYRCKLQPHLRTKDQFKVYPTYDFSCPIVDSIEGVTHSLRTSEYNDRNEQFYTILELTGLTNKPNIADYSRLNLQNTVLSKRKLAWIVDEGYVDGWDDPRMPTVRGILRHGMTIEGLTQFILAQGFGRCNTVMEWDKIWAFNKKVIDPIVPRYTALSAGKSETVIVTINGFNSNNSTIEVPKHPKNAELGNKIIKLSSRVLVDRVDANDFEVGSNVTFINWGNMLVKEIQRDNEGIITGIVADLNVDDKNFKNTLKITWLSITEDNSTQIPLSALFYGDLITKNILDKNDDFKDFLNKDSKKEECWLGDTDLKTLKKGDIIQIQRKGFFVCDEEYQECHPVTGNQYPLVLICIPEGNTKKRPTAGKKDDNKKGKANGGDKKNGKEDKKKENDEKKKFKDDKKEKKKAKEESKKDIKKSSPNSSDSDSKKKPSKSSNDVEEGKEMKKSTRVGMEAKKEEQFADWYRQILSKTEMSEYYNISGCYIILPWAFCIWERIQKYFDGLIHGLKVRNCNFPMFVTADCLMKEKEHIDDFSPEVLWVTKCGEKEMDQPIAIRPTSETVMYPYYKKAINAYTDLPLKLNQWCNVVRWETKQALPFLRSREFLWQEGHTAHETQEKAVEEVYQILDFYASIYENLLAVPVVKGKKTEKEKFAGADFTTTTEIYIESRGRAIQGATSHHLGQNFSKMFDIKFDTKHGTKDFVYQNSWGFTTRSLGVMVMVHSDNQGLCIPPRVVDIQVIIVPVGVTAKTTLEDKEKLHEACRNIKKRLSSCHIRTELDDDDKTTAGFKFNHWELKGVPIRMEVGPKEMKQGLVTLCYRYNKLRETVEEKSMETFITKKLDDIHEAMLSKARNALNEHRCVAYTMTDMCDALNQKMLINAPFCGDKSCEERIKAITAGNAVVEEGAPSMGAKSLCIPMEQPTVPLGDKCIQCEKKPLNFTMFGRSY